MDFKEGVFKKSKLHAASVKVHQIIELQQEDLNLIKIFIYVVLWQHVIERSHNTTHKSLNDMLPHHHT
jgi:hypothetical protein